MDGYRRTSRATVLGQDGNTAFVGPPWSIAGIIFSDFGFTKPNIIWHNSSTNETQIWGMFNYKVSDRRTVVDGDDGKPIFIAPPWNIVGSLNGDPGILWHNSSTGEIQIWFMDGYNGYRRTSRRTVLGEDEKPAFVGPPWSIVGVGPFSGKNDILWHNSSTGEIQIWLMDGYKLKGRRTVLGEDEKPAFVGPPWSIVGVGPFSGKNGILWHNSSTGEIQIWLMDGYKLKDRRTVLGEDEKPAFVGPPWGIVGISSFSRDRRLPRPGDPH
jgi:hypothetical protein